MKKILMVTMLSVLLLAVGVAFAGSPDKDDSSSPKRIEIKADEPLPQYSDVSAGQPEAYSEPEEMEKAVKEKEARVLKGKIEKKEESSKDKPADK